MAATHASLSVREAERKRCSRCGVTKEFAEFTARKTGRVGQYVAHCKKCNAAESKRRRQDDPTYYRRIEWPSKLKRYYGITAEDYYRMLLGQRGVCAICEASVPCVRRHKNRETEMFFVDHCHKTGKVRGLLCSACNRAIGYLKDNPRNAERVATYLRRSQP